MARQQDLLRFQVDEIEAAAPVPGEDGDLSARRTVLASAERLREAALAALSALSDERGAIDGSLAASKLLTDASRLDAALAPHAEQVEAAAVQLPGRRRNPSSTTSTRSRPTPTSCSKSTIV